MRMDRDCLVTEAQRVRCRLVAREKGVHGPACARASRIGKGTRPVPAGPGMRHILNRPKLLDSSAIVVGPRPNPVGMAGGHGSIKAVIGGGVVEIPVEAATTG